MQPLSVIDTRGWEIRVFTPENPPLRGLMFDERMRGQIPNTKLQTPEQFQISSSNLTVSLRHLGFGAWNFFGVWCLVFPSRSFHRRRLLPSLLQFPPGREDDTAVLNQFPDARVDQGLEVRATRRAGTGNERKFIGGLRRVENNPRHSRFEVL